MSRRATWGVLVVLIGLLVASWWATHQNKHQGEEAQQAQTSAKTEAPETSDTAREEPKKSVAAKPAGKAPTTKAPAKAPELQKRLKVKRAPDDSLQISPDWYRTRPDGDAGIPPK
jgi:cytoskeletal protein RodZ